MNRADGIRPFCRQHRIHNECNCVADKQGAYILQSKLLISKQSGENKDRHKSAIQAVVGEFEQLEEPDGQMTQAPMCDIGDVDMEEHAVQMLKEIGRAHV